MDSTSHQKAKHNEENVDEGSVNGGAKHENHTHDHDGFALRFGLPFQDSDKNSFDPIESIGSSFFPMEQQDVSHEIGNNSPKREAKRKYVMGMEFNGKEKADLDLDLSLSLPRGNSSNKWRSSSPKSENSCISMEIDSKRKDNIAQNTMAVEDSISLLLRGCTHCLLYVMVPNSDPKCPNCNTCALLDVLGENQAKKLRKN